MEQFLEGFFLQASLILALGAQNLYVLESGLRKRRHLLVASLCIACDVLLISLGVLGAASVFIQFPGLKIFFGVLGVAFLAYYGVLKLVSPIPPQGDGPKGHTRQVPIRRVVWQTLAFSLLNPHVYLDTLILIGGYSTQFKGVYERCQFGLGASFCSALWFFGLAIFAAAMSRYLSNPRVMRRVSVISGVVLILLSFKLGVDVWQWYEVMIS